ncbi:MAG: type II toxin-antitoxin system RelE/ParE family toxin [Planctomycetes bacterium]|nr:type II toxin-antitoxin system RelE/ParE family toxin [Planctomycetota bacterium]
MRGFEQHLVFYRPVEDGIEVVRVLHGARDLRAILGEEE